MKHAESIIINRPKAEVWALVGDPRSWDEWVPGLTDVRLEGDGAPSVGAALSYGWRGKRQDATFAAFAVEDEIGVASSEKNYEFSETIALHDTFGGTRVTVTLGFEPTVWWGSFLAILMFPVKGLVFGRGLQKMLTALRARVEAQPAG